MLERLDIVRNVGLFADYSHEEGCALGATTIIFGENGTGKSTIAAILDSLRECNPSEIIRRCRLAATSGPLVTVTLHGVSYTFDDSSWDAQPPYDTLEVFFSGFVSRNVHAASSVDPGQRRNLCEFVLGRNAVAKVARLIEADEQARAALTEKRRIESEIVRLVKPPDTLESYVALPPHPAIEAEIDATKNRLKQIQDRTHTLARTVPNTVGLPVIRGDEIAALLSRTDVELGQSASSMVREHIEKHLDDDGENWLSYGADHAIDDRCPYCGQDLSPSDLAKAIQSYFSGEYRAYSKTLASDIAEAQESLGRDAFARVRDDLQTQLAVAVSWGEFEAEEFDRLTQAVVDADASWSRGAQELDSILLTKLARPLDCMNLSAADDALQHLRRALELGASVNVILASTRLKAEATKASLESAEPSETEELLHRLENQKSRYEAIAVTLIEQLSRVETTREQLLQEKDRLKLEIDTQAARVVGKYQDGINHYLEFFGCDIRIDAVQAAFPSGRASVQFRLLANGHEIPLGCTAGRPCFETVLSEGDKCTLALSFFLARLRGIEDLAGRVVVLDDPVNSLGGARRQSLMASLRDLQQRGAQIVVLTHDERLAALIWRDRVLGHDTCLEVQKVQNASGLRQWDIETATQSQYVKDYLCLAGFLECGGNHVDAAASIRPYVEQRLRHLYPGPPFGSGDTLGKMISTIRDSRPGSRVSCLKDKLPVLEAINDAALPSHHASDDVPGWEELTPADVRHFSKQALEVLL